ncbi:FKBP-type peptidyl-prolyl cis-trans isomerase [Flaviaesturariibacter aridisoli]|uniref:Peptidyl-prolyl cis-trans isomerase n=1 Tax=Flaviaesturariibacter aridisoli TaxID=2545761 RepID=A0A4R4E4A9_9BACT|nr:FKBP-type peptidyl-prolyl cis-trans isomerase [Flaviaesturariibacter aridisoli]TCZ74406.1 hypothetical protein E0486_01920 [Flaviaesturariibacter aridisoli]
MKKTLAAGAAVVLLATTSCLKAKDTGCNYDECRSAYAPQSELDFLDTLLTNQGIQATEHCTGGFFQVVNPGTGASIDPCSNVNVVSQGWVIGGNRFDSTQYGNIDLKEVIAGWRALLPKIKVGGEINIYLPPTMAYGASGYQNVPANSYLHFNIRLTGVNL